MTDSLLITAIVTIFFAIILLYKMDGSPTYVYVWSSVAAAVIFYTALYQNWVIEGQMLWLRSYFFSNVMHLVTFLVLHHTSNLIIRKNSSATHSIFESDILLIGLVGFTFLWPINQIFIISAAYHGLKKRFRTS